VHVGPGAPCVALNIEGDLLPLLRIEQAQKVARRPQNGGNRYPRLAHGKESRSHDPIRGDAAEFLAQRFPSPRQHALEEFGIFCRRLVRRHGQAVPQRRAPSRDSGVMRVGVIVTHVKPDCLTRPSQKTVARKVLNAEKVVELAASGPRDALWKPI